LFAGDDGAKLSDPLYTPIVRLGALERVVFGLRRPKGNGSDDSSLQEIRN
jgi:hypothetical protein